MKIIVILLIFNGCSDPLIPDLNLAKAQSNSRWEEATGILMNEKMADWNIDWGEPNPNKIASCFCDEKNIIIKKTNINQDYLNVIVLHEVGHALGSPHLDGFALMSGEGLNSSLHAKCITEKDIISVCNNNKCTFFKPECKMKE